MKKILAVALLVFTLAACDKDKFETVPQVKIDSFGPDEAFVGDVIKLRATVTDKEGDVQDSVIVYRKVININTNRVITGSGNSDSIKTYIRSLEIPARQEYELEISYLYGRQPPPPTQNSYTVDRKYVLGIYVVDRAGNRSQYVESDTIILRKP